jgi:hypothetical protein
VVRASYETAEPDVARRQVSGANSRRPRSAQYGYAPDYTWLQGRLEHSRAADEWKLRYIPIDGTTDDYGGSVVLENPPALGDFGAGDLVRVYGELRESERDATTFAPVYRVSEAQPVAD